MKTAPGIVVQLVHIHGPLMGTIQEFDVPEIENWAPPLMPPELSKRR